MTSAINPSVPTQGEATTASVRANFATAANEITTLQNQVAAIPTGPAANLPINVGQAPYNLVGDGTTDNTAVLQAALNAASAAGGGSVTIGHLRLYIAGNVTVPYNVRLFGEYRHAAANYTVPTDWYNFGSQIKLASGATITVNSGSCDHIMFIAAGLYSALPMTPTAASVVVANFAGTAVDASNTSDTMISECMFLGFTTGIHAATASRLNVIDCRFDCTNGIFCSSSSDISRYHRNHFWPFLTALIPGVGNSPSAYLPLQRAGYAMKMEGNTWDQLVDCFQYGYYQGFWSDNCSNQVFTNCHSDYTNPSTNSVACFQFTGTSNYCKMLGCFSIAASVGVLINETGGTLDTLVEIVGGTLANVTGVQCTAGAADIIAVSFEVGGISWGTGTVAGSEVGCMFDGVATPRTFANSTVQALVNIIGPSYINGSPHGGNQIADNGGLTVLGPVNIANGTSASPSYSLTTTGNGTDQNVWDHFVASGSVLEFRAVNDAYTAANPWLTVTRSGYVPAAISLNAPISAPNLPINVKGPPYNAKGDGVTDDTAAINAAVAYIRTNLTSSNEAFKLVIPQGLYLITSPLNFTGLNQSFAGVDIVGEGAILLGKMSGGAVIDAFTSRWLRFHNLAIEGSSVTTPAIGIQIGAALGTPADYIELHSVKVYGNFTFTPFYNLASETFASYSSEFRNSSSTSNTFCMVLDGINHWSAHSTFLTVTAPANTRLSFNGNSFIECTWQGTSNTAVLWMSSTTGHKFVNCYGSNSSTCFLQIYQPADSSPAVEFLDFDCHMETTGLVTGIQFTGPSGHTFSYVIDIHARDYACTASTSIFGIDSSSSLTAVDLRGARLELAGAPLFDTPSKWTCTAVYAYLGSGVFNALLGQWQGPVANMNYPGTIAIPLTQRLVATNGGSAAITAAVEWVELVPAAGIAGYTLTMPLAPGGLAAYGGTTITISTTQTITTLTLTPNTSQSVTPAPGTLTANTSITYRYDATSSSWLSLGRTSA